MAPQYLQPTTQPWSEHPSVQGPIGSWTVMIIPSRIPLSHTLVFGLDQAQHGWEMADAIVAGTGPSCSSREYLDGLSRGPMPPQGTVTSPTSGGATTTSATTP
jgi:hypothetical protein